MVTFIVYVLGFLSPFVLLLISLTVCEKSLKKNKEEEPKVEEKKTLEEYLREGLDAQISLIDSPTMFYTYKINYEKSKLYSYRNSYRYEDSTTYLLIYFDIISTKYKNILWKTELGTNDQSINIDLHKYNLDLNDCDLIDSILEEYKNKNVQI